MTDLDKFREDTKKWLDKNCPPSMRNGADPKIPVDEAVSYTHLTLPTT